MNNLKSEDYYIGLDCGTSSIGYAVTDTEYNVLKFKGKAMWGSHIFEEAKTAKERRGARCARRRLERRKFRTALLQELFAEEIYKIDPTFFIRMNDSKYLQEDKHEEIKDIIFNDKNFKDKDYFKKYPTAYHLRKALITEQISDPRLLYLGINHIMKHRGHFLFPGENLNSVQDIKPLLENIKEASMEIFDSEISFTSSSDIEQALFNKSNYEKQEALKNCMSFDDSKKLNLIIRTILGYKIKPMQLFDNEEYEEYPTMEFKKISFEEQDLPVLEDGLNDDEFKLVMNLKGLFDWALLSSIMQGETYISNAKIKLFGNNKEDLQLLKRVIKEFKPEKYEEFFHSKANGSFSSYIGKNHDSHKNKEFRIKRSKTDIFYKTIRELLKDAPIENKDVEYILKSIEEDSFLPLLSSYRNGVIPYQVNRAELETILNKAKTVFPFLSDRDDDGLSVSEKIMSIFTYKIPYYVGPLGKNKNNPNSWLIRHENGRILPWNIEKKVDFESSAEKFILRMTNKCTYCKTEDVLAKNSLSYSKYMVLNELNNIRINDKKLSVEHKQEIFNNLFKKKKTVKKNQIIKYALANGWYTKEELSGDCLTGIDKEIKSSMKSYIDFKPWLEQGKLKADDVDQIIKWITLFPEGGNIIKNRIRKVYKNILTDSDIDSISKLKYSGWGRFSHKFLYKLEGTHKKTGEMMSIMKMLWNTQHNLMELLSNDYEFIEQIDQPKIIGKLNYQVVDDLYVSPSVKRQIWQTLKIVDEIKSIMKHNPKKVFIEVTRSEQEKKKTISRKNGLIEKLKDAQKKGLGFDIEIQEIIHNLEQKQESEISRQDKLFMYYSQCGKCMYSGKPIDIENIYNTAICDVDHIFPYSKTNDNSLNNRVLVLKKENARKSNDYPINDNIREKMTPFWKMLMEKELITKEKYNRLVRVSPLDDEDIKGFIARQLVETSQTVKATANILKSFFQDETKIVYSKAKAVSEFRQKFNLVKCRTLNELHHAKDAYLNIVVGNIHDTKYTSDFWKHADGTGYNNLSKPYDYNVEGAWINGKTGTIEIIRKTMNSNNVLFTRQPVARLGQLFDLQIVPKGSKKGALPIKPSDPVLTKKLKTTLNPVEVYDEWTAKYGGYNSMTTSYFAVIKHEEKNKTFASFIPISVIDSKKLSKDENLLKYCKDTLNLKNPMIIKSKLLMNTMLEIDGFRFCITGKSSGGDTITLSSAIPLFLSQSSQEILKRIESFNKKKKEFKNIMVDEEHDKLSNQDFSDILNELIGKCDEKIYKNRPGNQETILKAAGVLFDNLNPEDKCIAISEIIKYYSMNNGLSNFELIGGTKACGTLTKGARQNLDKTQINIIYQSITGLFEKIEKIEP